ncbi:hypothetical protein [Micrococcus luteus]|uniref:hypothetical protein n=1 Tax=Micrococcus luteus TaxID=1270 RepID=UPI003426F8A9
MADVLTLQAVREWAPMYLAVHGGDPAAALSEAPALVGLTVALDDAEAEAQGGPGAGGLEGAVAAALIAQTAGSTNRREDTIN